MGTREDGSLLELDRWWIRSWKERKRERKWQKCFLILFISAFNSNNEAIHKSEILALLAQELIVGMAGTFLHIELHRVMRAHGYFAYK